MNHNFGKQLEMLSNKRKLDRYFEYIIIVTVILIIIIVILFSSGCSSIKDKIDYVKSKYNKTNETEEIQCNKICMEDCPIPEGIEFDHAVYKFDNIENTFVNFIRSSDVYLICQFTVLENENIAKAIIKIDNKISLDATKPKILLDKSNTMDFCDVACIPKLNSQYNLLYSNNINLKLNDIHYTFCSNEKGIILTSKYFSLENNDADYALFIETKKLNKMYENEFIKKWGET